MLETMRVTQITKLAQFDSALDRIGRRITASIRAMERTGNRRSVDELMRLKSHINKRRERFRRLAFELQQAGRL
jgi:hypothetical protein